MLHARPFLLSCFALLAGLLLVTACDEEKVQGDVCSGNACEADSQSANDATTETDTSGGGEDSSTENDTGEADTQVGEDTREPDSTGGDTGSADTQVGVDTGEADTNVPDGVVVCGTGIIKGRVCSPLGTVWLSDVSVSIEARDCDGNLVYIEAFSDENGFYELQDVPSGVHSMTISTGSYTTSIENIAVDANKTTDLTGSLTKTCIETAAAKVAVLGGTFDHIETVLDFGLGIQFDFLVGDATDYYLGSGGDEKNTYLGLLKDRQRLLTYDILFINCGLWSGLKAGTFFLDPNDAELKLMVGNLLTFVNSGGSIYISDYAYYWGELVFPGAIDFLGDDRIEGEAKQGNRADNLTAEVLSPEFQKALRPLTSISIKFDLPAWVIAEKLGTPMPGGSTVHIEAPTVDTPSETLTNVPLVISYKPAPDSGTVYFTSFHHEEELNPEMQKVLNFLIFQL